VYGSGAKREFSTNREDRLISLFVLDWALQEEIKMLIRKAQGIRVNVIEQWEEEVAQDSKSSTLAIFSKLKTLS
jgi:hypothetical protein